VLAYTLGAYSGLWPMRMLRRAVLRALLAVVLVPAACWPRAGRALAVVLAVVLAVAEALAVVCVSAAAVPSELLWPPLPATAAGLGARVLYARIRSLAAFLASLTAPASSRARARVAATPPWRDVLPMTVLLDQRGAVAARRPSPDSPEPLPRARLPSALRAAAGSCTLAERGRAVGGLGVRRGEGVW